ncbi:MAG: Rne/Rng family ribonuclease, partial [Gammaproteobacteria bacterium]|nr:Rne/Rng family ribonuclease [Gammaproteobacteria bacterium]
MKRMLVNATQQEELRVAMVDGQRLYDLDLETSTREQKKSNIYKAKVTRVEPSLEAAFVDYGGNRHGFLPLKEISRSYFKSDARSGGRVPIKDAIQEGQEIVIQVEKDERGNKGAALTTFISLAGRYLVLMPNNPRAGGVSRRIEGEDRNLIREALSVLTIPEGMGLIVRTAGVGRNVEELQWDLDYLLSLWESIEKASNDRPAPFLIYQESNVIIRALRDYLRNDMGEILIDNQEIYKKAHDFMQQVMPHNLQKLKHYTDSIPLFTRYQIESQIESAFNREVRLPSGGSIVIDPTEALVSIDINSARATKGSDIEETALNTNLEAATEIATQLRLRDMGGLVVIDFIDMNHARNQREVENRLRDALKMDRARVQVGRISRFGLLEMSRQRLSSSLGEASQIVCPRCKGHGTIRGVESLALSVLRILEEEAMKENTERVVAQLPVNVATFLLNEKRPMINTIEERHKATIILIPNATMETPYFEVNRDRTDEVTDEDRTSYQMATKMEAPNETLEAPAQSITTAEQPAVTTVTPPSPAPTQKSVSEGGFIKRIFSTLMGNGGEKKKAEQPARQDNKRPQQRRQGPRPGAKRGTRGRKPGGNQQQRRSGQQQQARGAQKPQQTGTNKPEQKKDIKPAANSNEPLNQPADTQNTGLQKDKPSDSGRGKRRGRRGGRNRNRTSDNRTTSETTSPAGNTNKTNSEQAGQTQTSAVQQSEQQTSGSTASTTSTFGSVAALGAARREKERQDAENSSKPSPSPASSDQQQSEVNNREAQKPATQASQQPETRPSESVTADKPAENT